jgi:AcrR family transcriptional regulator
VSGAEPARLGLRERKKLMTRRAILDAAERMFAERGYDNVTVAEIADAVNIAAKTLFVYFPSKEDLVFHHEDEMAATLARAIRDRPTGTTPLRAIGDHLRDRMTASGPRAVTELDNLRRTVGTSSVLRARMRLMWEKFEEAVATELATEAGENVHAPHPRVVAAQLVLIYRLLASDEVLAYIHSHPKTKQRAAFTNWLDVSLELVGNGIQDHAPR